MKRVALFAAVVLLLVVYQPARACPTVGIPGGTFAYNQQFSVGGGCPTVGASFAFNQGFSAPVYNQGFAFNQGFSAPVYGVNTFASPVVVRQRAFVPRQRFFFRGRHFAFGF